jgi:hypothetical protein
VADSPPFVRRSEQRISLPWESAGAGPHLLEVPLTTPAKQAEADRASTAFHVALVQLGAETVEESLALWQQVPAGAETASREWLNTAVRLVRKRREFTRDLAMAYYRLTRALRTGATIRDPRKDESSVTLGDLRREFRELATPQAGAGEAEDADEQVLLEELDRLSEEQARIEKAAEEEVRIALEALGPNYKRRLIEDLDEGNPASEVDAARKEAHGKAGARQAAAAARVAMDGARSTVWTNASRDKRVIGYVRLSRTGTPCGWCAMLISRGFVKKGDGARQGDLYSSQKVAEYSDGDKYHDNCQCYAEPVYSEQDIESSELFALNRKYGEQWPQVTKGLSGKAALSAWRRFIRTEQAASRRRSTTTSVQEA